MDRYIGMDLGTGSLKCVLFDASGEQIAQASCAYPLHQPHNGWSEQEPEDWWHAAERAVAEVMAASGTAPSQVRGIGLSGQMMGLVCLGADGRPLRRAILWNDARTTEACARVRATVGDELLMLRSCTPARPGLTAAKIRWVQDEQPEVWQRTRHLLLPKDYLRLRLTGEYATDVSDASATQLLDVPARRWADDVLDAMGVSRDMLCRVFESQEPTGSLTPEAAEALGLTTGCVVVAGTSDNAAAAVGVGVVEPGLAMTTIGTSGTVFAFSERPMPDPNKSVYTFCMPVPGAWHHMGSVNSAGASLRWWRDSFYPGDAEYEAINADAASSEPGARRLVYLPYLNGEQSPHFDLDCRGAFVGLAQIHTRADMTRAVMEGVTYALRDVLTGIRGCGVEPQEMRMCGGGSKSPLWRQLMADVYGIPVTVPEGSSENAGALGAAILAMVGTGAYASVPEACRAIVRMSPAAYEPDAKNITFYNKVYAEFDKLYPRLKESFRGILAL
ncbi:MAG: xylulokinase [Atopobiaceae bacterium]|jgi:xylulokinase|nr:xylulokinase [Atopobiaceae bacterium]MCI1318346.1 xylulokinase [Atopobiaceae bacterium]MCI1388247.1 xylulokinase [Atopobiaceae bacterium]MCI1431503.1 xylulokinase [Atopobiaceae bacterium]MCI1469939.1 xylulokinase [Atopobiaceae bacterium]